MSTLLLQPIMVLPEWETVPAEPDAAIDYMAQWDYGEYSEDPEEVETLYPWYGNAWRKGYYVLQRFPEGTHTLYRVLSEEGSASSSVMDSVE